MRSSGRPTDSAADEPPAREVEDRELAVVERAADDLAVPRARGARRTRRRPVREVRPEVRHLGEVRRPAGDGRRGGLALRAGDLPVLDPHAAAVQHRVVLARVAGAPDARRRGRERRGAGHAAGLAQLEPGRAGEHHVGHRAGAHHDEVGVDASAPTRSTRDRAARRERPVALEAPPAGRRSPSSIPRSRSTPAKNAPTVRPEVRSRAARPRPSPSCSACPAAVSDAATSQAM